MCSTTVTLRKTSGQKEKPGVLSNICPSWETIAMKQMLLMQKVTLVHHRGRTSRSLRESLGRTEMRKTTKAKKRMLDPDRGVGVIL